MVGGALIQEDLSEIFSGIEDPRVDRNKKYPLGEIAGVESWRGLELVGNEKINFLRKYLPYVHGICSHQTISRVFSLQSPKFFLGFSQFARTTLLRWMGRPCGVAPINLEELQHYTFSMHGP